MTNVNVNNNQLSLREFAHKFTGIILFDGEGAYEVRTTSKFFYFSEIEINYNVDGLKEEIVFQAADTFEEFDLSMINSKVNKAINTLEDNFNFTADELRLLAEKVLSMEATDE